MLSHICFVSNVGYFIWDNIRDSDRMIIGMFLRHYKCYKGARFLPFIIDEPKNLKVFIGNNGAGKSSVLEALDTFFNNREWTIHIDAKKTEAYVAPLFLSEKDKLERILSKSTFLKLKVVSDAFWNVVISSNGNFKKYYEPFFILREKLESYRDSHFLFSFSKEFDNMNISFSPFDSHVKSQFDPKLSSTVINKICEEVISHISYLYIPVETSISEFLRLETRGMQELMNVDIKRQISTVLNEKRIKSSNGGRVKRLNLLDIINSNLEDFINEIEKVIQKIDSEYNFEKDINSKSKLTASHVTDVIIASYFSKRRLKKSKKSIVYLSAGERKRALIDIAYTFLSQNVNNDKDIILAVDEPESSLHISQCYEQFSRIDSISELFDNQVFITTHWYGALPILNRGILHHIDNTDDVPVCKSFDLNNYFEDRRNHPDDIHLKSFFDLSSSIISSLRLSPVNWLLVEGNEDRKYLNYYLEEANCKIIPLGGCGVVKLIYEYLCLPLSQGGENLGMRGKVFCLIDSDDNGVKLEPSRGKIEKIIRIKRLQFNSNEDLISLVRVDDPLRSATEIEESLDPLQFYVALGVVVDKCGDIEVYDSYYSFEFDDSAKCSFIKGDFSILNHLGNGRNVRKDKLLISKFIDDYKKEIATEYISYSKVNIPNWINEIKLFFEA